MEPASKYIAKLALARETVDTEDVVRAAWRKAVGKKIAARTRPARMVRTRLIVEVQDATWQRQLFSLSGQILGNLARQIGAGLVDDLEFRVVPLRIEPQLARCAAASAAAGDDADAIADPVLRRIYRSARKKSLA